MTTTIDELITALISILENPQSKNVSEEYELYASLIITKLLENPGQLIDIKDPDLLKKAEKAINYIWENVDEEKILDEIVSGKMIDGVQQTGLTVFIMGDYMNRALMLKPTLVSIKPNIKISTYFQNAMECWIFGINTAALILCCSVIDSMLNDVLKENRISLVKENGKDKKSLATKINDATNNSILDRDTQEMAHNIRKLRRGAVHYLEEIDETIAFNAVMNTKKIIVKILTQ